MTEACGCIIGGQRNRSVSNKDGSLRFPISVVFSTATSWIYLSNGDCRSGGNVRYIVIFRSRSRIRNSQRLTVVKNASVNIFNSICILLHLPALEVGRVIQD